MAGPGLLAWLVLALALACWHGWPWPWLAGMAGIGPGLLAWLVLALALACWHGWHWLWLAGMAGPSPGLLAWLAGRDVATLTITAASQHNRNRNNIPDRTLTVKLCIKTFKLIEKQHEERSQFTVSRKQNINGALSCLLSYLAIRRDIDMCGQRSVFYDELLEDSLRPSKRSSSRRPPPRRQIQIVQFLSGLVGQGDLEWVKNCSNISH